MSYSISYDKIGLFLYFYKNVENFNEKYSKSSYLLSASVIDNILLNIN